jgi:hypothetical protein
VGSAGLLGYKSTKSFAVAHQALLNIVAQTVTGIVASHA